MPPPRRLLLAAALLVAVLTATAGAAAPIPHAGRTTLVVAQEEDVDGFNTALTCCSELWAGVQLLPVIRGAYVVDRRLRHVPDLVASAHANAHGVTYTIRANAAWNWGGRRLPVTYQDFVYTWQQLVSPANAVVDRDGYDRFTGFTHAGLRKVTFTWTQPYPNWQDLFPVVYPSEALQGVDFNHVWQACICGSDGKPVADGPYTLTSYVRGEGSTLDANPFWYGKKPAIRTIAFKLIPGLDAEVQALREGQVDLIEPAFGLGLAPLSGAAGIRYDQAPGLTQEHVDIQFGTQASPLLRGPWMRRALLRGINRAAVIQTVLGPLARATKPLNSIVYSPADAQYRGHFARWTYNQRQALSILAHHCTGGPARPSESNAAYFVCSGYPAQFRYTYAAGNPVRATQAQVIAQQLRAIGIQLVVAPLPANAIFGSGGLPSGNFDLADFSWTTSPDPSAYIAVWGCGGAANWLGYCNRAATNLLVETTSVFDQKRRASLFEQADALFARDVPTIPLYSLPNPLAWNASLVGPQANPQRASVLWNVERWRWRR